MALQSEVSPPMVGDPKKDTKIDGDTKSDEEDTSQSSEDEIDLEEGEILDSGAEEEKEKTEKDEKDKEEKDFTNSSLKDALDKNCLQNIEQMIKGAEDIPNPNRSKISSPRKTSKRHANYRDHDQAENSSEQNDNWFRASPKNKKPENRPMDYRNELEAYRGTPPSSPDRKKRERRKKSSKKSKKSSRKTITRKDAKGQRVMRYKKDAARGKPCKYYKDGHCHKGADCPFSHVSPEPRFKKKELCKFYLSGHCNKGKHCVYMHEEFPCKFHHTGSVCYAKQDCRFSHDALTDEMKKVLADYLRQVHGDRDHHRDDFIREEDRENERGPERERKRHHSQSPELPPHQVDAPPPTKRVCLLGSPPRRIRESEETKRWQEEMKMLQQQNHPSFHINVMADEEDISAHFPKPNFYQETLLNSSPQQHPLQMDVPPPVHNPLVPPPGFNPPIFPPRMFNEAPPVHDNYAYEDEFQEVETPPIKQEPEDHYDWGEPHHMNDVKPNRNLEFSENSHQELDFTNDVKFDETTQFSEMESSIDGPPALSPASALAQEGKESESETSNPDSVKFTEKSADASNPNPMQDPPAPPIVAPSHLPRKQRELFMRVQQHNLPKENLSTIENTIPEIKKESDMEEKIEPKIEESNWYSSEEDDEDSDEMLTEKLKKIQQGPPPPTKPPTSLMEMLNKIQQNTLEKKAASGNQQPNLLAPFLKGIFETVPAVPNTVAVLPATSIVPELKRRTLLPDPVLPALSLAEPVVPKIVPKDPRLKNRDPRTLAALPTPLNATKRITSDVNNIGHNSPTIDMNSFGPKPLTTITNESPKDNIPYKLHGIYTRPPNYTPYLHASQSNPKLLNDPRLRKHLQPTPKVELPVGNGKDFEVIKTAPPKDAPPIPELLLKYEKPDSFINIFESNSPTKSPGNAQDSKHPLPMAAQRVCDPRMIRRDSRSNSGSDTPPHLTIVDTIKSPPHQEFKSAPVLENAFKESVCEKKILPPVLEKSWTPPVLEKSPPTVVIKKEPESDSESNYCPPKLEFSGKYSFKKSPSPEREFIAITKESPSHDDGTTPVVPPLIIKKIKPTLASHLPRAIADPRMAKLHNPMDPRRLRLASSEKSLVERKVSTAIQGSSKLAASSIPEESISSCASDISKSPSGEGETVLKEEKPKTAKSIPKKRRLSDKSEEKKKTVHRNRKSSMDYASPLHSCDATVTQSSSGYNSYNQRPKRSTHPLNDRSSNSTNLSSADSADTSSIPNFLISDNSNNDCDNSSDGNLKDRFKTIDPTASPFC